MANPPFRGIAQIHQREHDEEAVAKRVVSVIGSPGGNIPEDAGGKTVSYEDTDFTSSDSPAVLDVNTDLGRRASQGYITCDGPGNILIEISDDGSEYGGQHTLKNGETLVIEDIIINKIKLTHVLDSAYRALIY